MEDPGNWRRLLRSQRAMHISTHAAHACYFIVLSVFPLLVLMFGILRYTALQPADLLDLISALLPEALLRRLLSGLRERFDIPAGIEFTTEANPGTLTPEWLDAGIYPLPMVYITPGFLV